MEHMPKEQDPNQSEGEEKRWLDGPKRKRKNSQCSVKSMSGKMSDRRLALSEITLFPLSSALYILSQQLYSLHWFTTFFFPAVKSKCECTLIEVSFDKIKCKPGKKMRGQLK